MIPEIKLSEIQELGVEASEAKFMLAFQLAIASINFCKFNPFHRKYLALLYIAHILTIMDKEPGFVDSAVQGSVSVHKSLPNLTGSGAAFYTQTQWGLLFWQATAPYRQMRIIAGRPHVPLLYP